MKPNFALDLTHEGIALMHRGKGGWVLVGEVGLDDPDLPQSIAVIRQRAVDLEKTNLGGGGFTSKLIIPPSQILFTTMTAPGPDDVTRDARIREGLEGLTPYPVADLVFDWYADGDMAHVAIVARDTLAEAEGFASDNYMNPVSLVARPHGSFGREAFFGPTSCASDHLRADANIEREHRAPPELMGTGAAPLPLTAEDAAPPAPRTAPPPTEDLHNSAATDSAPEQQETPSSTATTPSVAPPELAPFPPDFEPEETSASIAPAALPPLGKDRAEKPAEMPTDPEKPTPPPSSTSPSAKEARADTAAPAPQTAKPSKAQTAEKTTKDPIPAFSSRRDSTNAAPTTPTDAHAPLAATQTIAPRITVAAPQTDVPSDAPPVTAEKKHVQKQVHVPVTAPTVGDDKSQSKGAKATSKRKKSKGNGAGQTLRQAALKGLSGAAGAASAATSKARALTKTSGAKTNTAKASGATSNEAHTPPNGATSPAETNAKANGKTPPPLPIQGNSMQAPTPEPDRQESADTAIAPPPPSARSTPQKRAAKTAQDRARKEAEALTIFGARKAQDVGGKPKYLGLFLVLGLLLLLAVVAVWSMFFLNEQTADLFPEREDQFEGAITTGVTPDAAQTGGDLLATPPVAEPAQDTEEETDTALVETQDEPLPPSLSPEMAETRYAATGIWERAPDAPADPSGGRIDALYVASIDPQTVGHDAVALPPARLSPGQIGPATTLPPPPQGTKFDLDARGLVRATPEGSLTPAGIYVYARRPDRVPLPRPGGVGPQEEIVALPAAGPDLPKTRPPLRPDGLIESNERQILGGRTRSELAALRPPLRPARVIAAIEAAAATVAGASDQAPNQAAAIADAIAGASTANLEGGAVIAPTAQAVARSPEPRTRPRNFDKLMEAARSAQDSSDGSVVVAAAPRNQTVTPSIPTRASVAKQATIKNAIPLRKVALIGISGSASNRKALVRLKSGRYVKVGVGDRLDGGRVVSISASQLVYKKGSRSTTLKILPFG